MHSTFFDENYIVSRADAAMSVPPPHITDSRALHSEGGIHDFYSNGDYWWKNPDTPNGLPFIRRDGMSNPDNFCDHRLALRRMRTAVADLAAGYKITGNEAYAERAARLLYDFFLAPETYMAPHLKYAQAIPGICSGRGIGIIDTLHLTEIPFAVKALSSSPAMTAELKEGVYKWFSEYLSFMNTHSNGIEERDCHNNHAVCWHVQALSFALFTDNKEIADECIQRYKTVLLPNQMRADGGFTDELGRTKPYGYSIFVLDNMVTLVHLASLIGEDLWSFTLSDGRSIMRGLEFLMPYLEDKSKWFLLPDVEHFDAWPARASFMVFAGLHTGQTRYSELYMRLPTEATDSEVRRNLAIRQPILMI